MCFLILAVDCEVPPKVVYKDLPSPFASKPIVLINIFLLALIPV